MSKPVPALSKSVRAAAASARRKMRMKNAKGAIVFTREELDAITPPLKPGQESIYDVLVRTGMIESFREMGELRAQGKLPPLDHDALRKERN